MLRQGIRTLTLLTRVIRFMRVRGRDMIRMLCFFYPSLPSLSYGKFGWFEIIANQEKRYGNDSYEQVQRRQEAAIILDSPELLMMHAQARNDVRSHFIHSYLRFLSFSSVFFWVTERLVLL